MDSDLRKHLQPGAKVKVTQQIAARNYSLPTVIEGTVVDFSQTETGSWFAHSRNDKLWLDRLVLRKEDGEITTLNLDDYSVVEVLKDTPTAAERMDCAVFGNLVADVIGTPIDLCHPPAAGSLQFINSILLTSGGSVCNVGMAMARLGMQVAAAGMVGDDLLGRSLLERLRAERIDISSVLTSTHAQTSATIATVDANGERTFFHTPGATALLNADVLRRCFPVFRQCAWVHLAYFGLLPGLENDLPTLFQELKQTAPGAKIALDTLNPPAKWELLEPILAHLDLFAPSRPEAIALSGSTDPLGMIQHFRRFMPQGIIAIKFDNEGCMVEDGSQLVQVPAYRVKVVDTTGAGDAWFAGFLVGLRKNFTLEHCARLANRVAADCCTALGGSTGIRDYEATLRNL